MVARGRGTAEDRQTEQLKASVTKSFQARFRRAANGRKLTESDLIRELAEGEVKRFEAKPDQSAA